MSQLSLINRIYNFKIFNFSLFASLLFFSISYFLHSAPVTIVFEGTGTLTRSAVKSTFAAKNLSLDAPIHIVVRQHTAIGANAFNPDHVGDSEPLMRNIESLTVEDGCLAIDSQAFAYCTGLTTVNIRSNLLTISFMAFFGCSSLINVTLPETVQTISNRVFSACEKLEISKLPGNLTTLGEIAFSSCKKITSISFPEGLAIIGKQCFAQCVSLAKITLPSSIKIIQKEAFSGCINLQQVDCYAAEPPLLGIAAFNLSSSSKLLYVVSTSLESYKKDMDLDCSSQSNYEIGCYGWTNKNYGGFSKSNILLLASGIDIVVSSNDISLGVVTPSGTINAADGDILELTAVPNATNCCRFLYWKDVSTGQILSEYKVLKYIVAEAANVQAVFE